MGADIQLLGENLPVPGGLVEHEDKVAVLKDVLNFPRSQQILDILRNAS